MKKLIVAFIIGVLLLGIPAQSLTVRRLDEEKRKSYWEKWSAEQVRKKSAVLKKNVTREKPREERRRRDEIPQVLYSMVFGFPSVFHSRGACSAAI